MPALLAVVALLMTVSMMTIHEDGTFMLIVRSAGPLHGTATSINELSAAQAGLAGAGIGGLVVSLRGFNALGVYLSMLVFAAPMVTYMAMARIQSA